MASALLCTGASVSQLLLPLGICHWLQRKNMRAEPPEMMNVKDNMRVCSQTIACCRILTAQDYALVLGMPGTGKTAVICVAVRSLLAARKTVLVTSYTNRCQQTCTSHFTEDCCLLGDLVSAWNSRLQACWRAGHSKSCSIDSSIF